MSRPIVEPSTPLDLGKKGFSIHQLQRRPAQGGFSDFGATTQEVFLPEFADSTNSDASSGVGWIGNADSYGGGYVTRTTSPSDGDYFSFMSYFAPIGGVFSFRFLNYVGPDYGILRFEIASLGYELTERPSGCPGGKIQDFVPSYGDAITYLSMGTHDGYSAVEGQPFSGLSNFQLIVGGDLGAPLTDLSDASNQCADNTGADPYSGFPIIDGGPGWYRTRIRVDGKNASSTGYKFRVTRVAWSRVDDLGAV